MCCSKWKVVVAAAPLQRRTMRAKVVNLVVGPRRAGHRHIRRNVLELRVVALALENLGRGIKVDSLQAVAQIVHEHLLRKRGWS